MNDEIDRCQPATFGDKRRTRFDRSVRDAVQLKAGYGGFSVEHFAPEAAGILDSKGTVKKQTRSARKKAPKKTRKKADRG